MDGHGHINTARCEHLSKKTKVMQYQLQKDYLKDRALHLQYRSFITSLLHACTRMVPRSIWRVKILGLPWKKFFPRDESWHLAWHFTTRVFTFHDTCHFHKRRGFPCNESWYLHATCMTVVIHNVIRQTNPREILLWL